MNPLNDQLQIVRDMNRAIQSRMGDIERSLSEQETQLEMLKGLYERMGRTQKSTETLSDTIKSVRSAPPVDPTSVAELTKSLSDGGKDFNKDGGGGILSKIGGAFKAVGGAAFAVIGMGLSSLFGLIKGVLKISKFSIQSIFDIGQQLFNLAAISISIVKLLYEKLLVFAQEAFSGGGSEYAQAIHDLKKQYGSLDQGTPKAILQMSRSMGALSKAGLSAFRIFGNKAERIKEFLEEYATKMGTVFDFYAREFAESEGALIATVKGMGLSGEDMEIMGRSAISRGMALADELVETHNATRKATRALGSATKLISRDIAKAMRNVKAFGGSSKESIGKAAAYARSLGLNIDGLTGIAESFHTYDSAVETGEKLLEIFGVRVNAYEMMKEQDVGAMIEHLREGFVNAGVDTTALNKSYLSLLSSTVGLDADVARQLLSYKNVGGDLNNTEDAGLKVAEGIKTLSGALDDLASSIEFKVLSGGQLEGGFISMFLQGLYRAAKMNSYIRPLLRDIVQSLRIVYREGIRTFQAFEQYFPGIHDFLEGIRRFFNPQRFSQLIARVNDTFINLFKGAKDGSYNFTNFYNDIYEAFVDHLDKFNEIDDGRLFDSLWKTAKTSSKILGAVFAEIGSLFAAGIRWITSLISGNEDANLKKVFTDLLGKFDGTFSAIGDTVKTTVDKISGAVSSLVSSFEGLISFNSFDLASQSTVENIVGFFNVLKDRAVKFFDDSKKYFVKTYDMIIDTIKTLQDARKVILYITAAVGGLAFVFLGAKWGAQALGSMSRFRPKRLPGTSRLMSLFGNGTMSARTMSSFDNISIKSRSFSRVQRELIRNLFGADIQKLSIFLEKGAIESAFQTSFEGFDERVLRNKELIAKHGQKIHDLMSKIISKKIKDPVQKAAAQTRFLDPLAKAISASQSKSVVGNALARIASYGNRIFGLADEAAKSVSSTATNVVTKAVKPTLLKTAGRAAAKLFVSPKVTIPAEILSTVLIETLMKEGKTKDWARAGNSTFFTAAGVAGGIATGGWGGLALILLSLGSDLLYLGGAGIESFEDTASIGLAKRAILDEKTDQEIKEGREGFFEGANNVMKDLFPYLRYNSEDRTILTGGEQSTFGSKVKELHDELFGSTYSKYEKALERYNAESKSVYSSAGEKNTFREFDKRPNIEDFVTQIPLDVFDQTIRYGILQNIIAAEVPGVNFAFRQSLLNSARKNVELFVDSIGIEFFLSGLKEHHGDDAEKYYNDVLRPSLIKTMFDSYYRKSKDPQFLKFIKFADENRKIIEEIHEEERKKNEQLRKKEWDDYNKSLEEYNKKVKDYNHFEKFKEMVSRNLGLVFDFIKNNIVKDFNENLITQIKKIDDLIGSSNLDFSKVFIQFEDLNFFFKSFKFNSKELLIKKFGLKGGGDRTPYLESTDRVDAEGFQKKLDILILRMSTPNIDTNETLLDFTDFSLPSGSHIRGILSSIVAIVTNIHGFITKITDKNFLKNINWSVLPDTLEIKLKSEWGVDAFFYNIRDSIKETSKIKDISIPLDNAIPAVTLLNDKFEGLVNYLSFATDLFNTNLLLNKVAQLRKRDVDLDNSSRPVGPPSPQEIGTLPQIGGVEFDLSGIDLISKPVKLVNDFIGSTNGSSVIQRLESFINIGTPIAKTHIFINKTAGIISRILDVSSKITKMIKGSTKLMNEFSTEGPSKAIKSFKTNLSALATKLDAIVNDIETKTAVACSNIFSSHVDIHDQIIAHGLTKEDLASPEIVIGKNQFFKGPFIAHSKQFSRGDVTYSFTYKIIPFESRTDFENKVFLSSKSVTLDRINAVLTAPEKPLGAGSYVNTNQVSTDIPEEFSGTIELESKLQSQHFDGTDWTIKPNQKYYIRGAWDTARQSN